MSYFYFTGFSSILVNQLFKNVPTSPLGHHNASGLKRVPKPAPGCLLLLLQPRANPAASAESSAAQKQVVSE